MYPDWEAISAIGQMLGAVGVIVSLIYVALQVRADARARRAQTTHQQSQAFTDMLHGLASDKEIADLVVKGRRDFSALNEAEMLRFGVFTEGTLRIWEDSYFQFLEGHLSDRVWNGMAEPLNALFSYPGIQTLWQSAARNHSPEFRAFVDAKIAALKASDSPPVERSVAAQLTQEKSRA